MSAFWLLWMRVKYLPYRPVQRLLHRLNLHYMPLSHPDGDTLAWCRWCGIQYVVTRADYYAIKWPPG